MFLCQNIEQTCSHELHAACDYCLLILLPLILLDRIPAGLPPEVVPSAHPQLVAVLPGDQVDPHLILSGLIVQYGFGGAKDPFRGISRIHRGMHVIGV